MDSKQPFFYLQFLKIFIEEKILTIFFFPLPYPLWSNHSLYYQNLIDLWAVWA